jgi:hypothetical protein
MARAGNDLPNRIEVLADALQGYLYDDDEQLALCTWLDRVVDPAHPGVTIRVRPFAADRYGKPIEPVLL